MPGSDSGTPYVFVSYSSADRARVFGITGVLEAQGIHVWLDRRSITGGQRRGSVTKVGDAHIRHGVVEAAWNYQHMPRVGEGLRKRSEGQPEKLKEVPGRAQLRPIASIGG